MKNRFKQKVTKSYNLNLPIKGEVASGSFRYNPIKSDKRRSGKRQFRKQIIRGRLLVKCSLFFNCCTHDILFLFEHLEFCNCVCKTICFSLLTNKEQVLERLIKRFLNSFRLDLHYLHGYRNNSGGERRCSLFLFFCQMSVSLLSSGGFCSKSCIYKTNTRVHYVTRSLLSL